ncbi:MAG: hypothetical protein ACC662_10040, partial [Planctomycetota bacterium]
RIPAAWAELRKRWKAASQAERAKQRTYWETQLLLPNPLLPPPPDLRTFRSEGDQLVFSYPASWVADRTRDADTDYLFLGPPGTQATWSQVVDPTQSPAGVFLAVTPLEDELRAVATPEAGARLVARRFVTSRAPGLREVTAFRVGAAGFVVLRGRLPGRNDEWFAWVAAVPFGSDHVLAGRFAGPLSEVESLLPVFSTLLATIEVASPDDSSGLAVNLAAATIGNAVVSAGWSD